MGKSNAGTRFGCPEWREAISAMADGELSPSEQNRVWQHLQTCPDCRQYYRQLQAVRKRIHRTNWALLWSKAVRENRRLRRLLVAGVLLAALASAGITFGLVRRFTTTPQMTPTVAIGVFRYHLSVPPEWSFNPNCQSGVKCMTEKASVMPVRFPFPKNTENWERAGICECLGAPLVVYLATFNGHPLMLLHFNTSLLPLRADEGSKVCCCDKTLRCYVTEDVHLLFWQEGKDGFALLVPFGKLNPFQIIPHIKVVARGQKGP